MIAKVRIAPVEQWCDARRKELTDYPDNAWALGAEISIITESMTTNNMGIEDIPGTRFWSVTEETRQRAMQIVGEHRGSWVCEHMLEMD